MPIPIGLAAAGISALASGANTYAQGKMNKKTRDFSLQMYDRQRRDSLADWQMVNEYNSPAETMKRLKAAGLNPNLVYDNGATTTAAPVRSSSVEGWNPDPPRIDTSGVTSSLFAGYDVELKKVQTDNVAAATEVAKQEALLKAAQTAGYITQNSQSEYNLQLAKKLESITLEKAAVELQNLKAGLKVTLDNNERQAALTKNTLAKGVEEILNLRAQRSNTQAGTDKIRQEIINLRKDGTLKQLDIKMREKGIYPGDPAYMRILNQLFDKDGTGISKIAADLLDFLVDPEPKGGRY